MQGKIVKGIAGFYYVYLQNQGIYECKAKGVFRKNHVKPLVGDDAEITILSKDEKLGNITDILPRKNELIRPAVANIDQALVIFSIVKPEPNLNLLDRFLVMMERQGLTSVICFNKQDIATLQEREKLRKIYEPCGYPVLFASATEKEGIDAVKDILAGKTTAVAGPSGVGKSSLINALQTDTCMETGAISEKIERGRHTTRHSELILIEKNSYIMDTPGFSSLQIGKAEKEELREYYPEFRDYEKKCRFQVCSHTHEPDCGVKKALLEDKISKVRYDNYVLLYEEQKNQRKY